MQKWKEIDSLEAWGEVLGQSETKPLLVFKHSTTCPISAEAFSQFEQFLSDYKETDLEAILVKVIEARPVSNQIAEELLVKHESPQAILVLKQGAVWNASHWKITAKALEAAIHEKVKKQ